MISIYWAIFLCLLVLIFIPLERIRQLWPVPLISAGFLFTLDYFLISTGYYRFTGEYLLIGGMPFFYLLGGAAAGILLVNWMKKGMLNKALIVTGYSLLFLLSEYVFIQLGAFQHLGGWTFIHSILINLFGLSLLSWLSLSVVGRERIYKGYKSRFRYFLT